MEQEVKFVHSDYCQQYGKKYVHFKQHKFFAINLNFTENLSIGLLNVAAGGTSIESWVDPAISKGECSELSACDKYNCTGGLHYGMVQPFVNMTVKYIFFSQRGSLWG